MSRCFSFPPPGYEQKARPEDLNLIAKEKHKQKKHKDKKEKHKKERKEKERSEGKHKEDKDRKQKKHKDKKDKKKDKRRSSEQKKNVGPVGNQNGEKLGPDSRTVNGIQDPRILVELGKRVRDECGATDNGMVQKVVFTGQRNTNLLGEVEENGNGTLAERCGNIKNKREHNWMANGQGLKFHANGSGNVLVGNFSGGNQIKDGSGQVDEVGKRRYEKDKNERRNNDGKGDGHRNEDVDKNRKAEDKKRKKEKKEERSKEKIKQGASDGNFLDLRDNSTPDFVNMSRDSQAKLSKTKEPISNGFLHAKASGIRPNNISRPAFSSHQVSQNGSGFHSSLNIINFPVEKGSVIKDQKVNGKLSSSLSVSKNVKNMEPGRAANHPTAEHRRATVNNHVDGNGLISNVATMESIIKNVHADDKFPTSILCVENGRKMAGPNIDKAVARREPDASHKIDNKEIRINGMFECVKHTSNTPSPSIKAKEKIGANMKPPPHPDLKYLSQILTVPKVQWPQNDDDAQEWLFGCLDSRAKRPKLASSQIESIKSVWAEAMQVESADATALPYVIPY